MSLELSFPVPFKVSQPFVYFYPLSAETSPKSNLLSNNIYDVVRCDQSEINGLGEKTNDMMVGGDDFLFG